MWKCCSSTPKTPILAEPIETALPIHRPADPLAPPSEQAQSLALPEQIEEKGKFHLTMLVIGKVDHESARILIEVLEDGDVTCQLRCVQLDVRTKHTLRDGSSDEYNPTKMKLRPEDSGFQLLEVTHPLKGGHPRVFQFQNLKSDARYEVSIQNLAHLQPSSQFRTFLKDWKITSEQPAMRLATVSCNLLSETLALKPDQHDLWTELALRVQRDEIDMVVHMGDQVYADEMRSDGEVAAPASAYTPETHALQGQGLDTLKKFDQLVFKKGLALIKDKNRIEWDKYIPEIEELYRQLYRETWSHRPTAVVLANVPNLTIYDDHDFVDNWGSQPHHRDKDRTSPDFFVALRARQVYWEYQGSLHSDVDLTRVEMIDKDHHMHTFGEYGIIFTESRSAGSFRYNVNDKTPFLGRLQWEDLDREMNPGGMFDHVKHLVIVCPCPVVYLPHGLNGAIESLVPDALGHWACEPFRAEQTRMLNLALAWQEGPNFGATLEHLEHSTPPKPKGQPEDTDLYKSHGVKMVTFPSLAGAPLEVAAMKETPAEMKAPTIGPDGEEEKKDSRAFGPTSSSSSGLSACRSDRRVTFVGGDVHVGGHTRLYKHGHHVLDQLVSSAISNHVLPTFAFKIGEWIQNSYTTLEDGWSFEHQGFTKHRNFGMVDTIRESTATNQRIKTGNQKPIVVTSIVSAE